MFRPFIRSSSGRAFTRKIVEAFHRYLHTESEICLSYERILMCRFWSCREFDNWWQVRKQNEGFLDDGVRWIMASGLILRERLAQ
jgi:hypothetical protein